MSYQLKYQYEFLKLKSNEPHRVELWQDTAEVLTVQELTATINPFVVEMPELDHKFQVVRGRGFTGNVISDSSFELFNGLYHVNPQEFKVLHYIWDVLSFCGYLNAEMVTEPYDQTANYPVQFTGNDGFSLMDRFSFVQSDGTQYTGIKSKFDILQIIFGKIALPYYEYRIALSTTFVGYTDAIGTTILKETYVDCANFYDEDQKPMTLREVVESILAPYGAYIRAENGAIYITDIHTIAAGGSVTYKQFSTTTGLYTGFTGLPNEKTITEVGLRGMGQQIEQSGGVNRQIVSYSPYPVKNILEETVKGFDEFTVPSGVWDEKSGYFFKTLSDNLYWDIDYAKTIVLNPSTFEASYATDPTQATAYLRYPRYGGLNGRVFFLKNPKRMTINGATINDIFTDYTNGLKMIINGEILAKTKNNVYDSNYASIDLVSISISIRLKIGGRYYDNFGDTWVTTPTVANAFTVQEGYASISDKFVPFGISGAGFEIGLGNNSAAIVLSGDFEFEIWSDYWTQRTHLDVPSEKNSTDIKEIWLRNISIRLVNFDGSEIHDENIEYIGLLDKTFQNEGKKIELTCGTDTLYSDKGKLLKYDGTEYSKIQSWTRAGQTYKIEELLLASLSSNYRSGYYTITGLKVGTSFKLQNVITDTFIGTRKMMIQSASINYHEDQADISIVEIKQDELTIVKDSNVH